MQAMGNMHIMFKDDNMAGSSVSGVQLQLLWCVHTLWRVIIVESRKRPSKFIFVVLNFMTATSTQAMM